MGPTCQPVGPICQPLPSLFFSFPLSISPASTSPPSLSLLSSPGGQGDRRLLVPSAGAPPPPPIVGAPSHLPRRQPDPPPSALRPLPPSPPLFRILSAHRSLRSVTGRRRASRSSTRGCARHILLLPPPAPLPPRGDVHGGAAASSSLLFPRGYGGDQTRAALAPSRAALLRRPRPPPWPPPRHGRRAPRACLASGRTSAAGTQGRRPRLGPSWGWVRSLAGRRLELRRREAGASPRRPTSALSAGGMAGACPVRHRGAWASPRRPPGPYQGAWPELRLGPAWGRGRSSTAGRRGRRPAWALRRR